MFVIDCTVSTWRCREREKEKSLVCGRAGDQIPEDN